MTLDLSRQEGQLCGRVLERSAVAAIGVGRSGAAIEMLAASGVPRFWLCDPAIYDTDNRSQYGIGEEDVGVRKIDRIKLSIQRINPAAKVETFFGSSNDLPNLEAVLADYSLVLDSTDKMAAARELSRTALHKVDMLHLKTTGDNRQFMLTGTLPDYAGCVRCIHKSACDAVEGGHRPAAFYHSHRVVPEGLNVKAVWVALGLLHFRAGSTLPIAEVGKHFAGLPAWIGYNGIAPGGEIFPVRAWREPLPPRWKCPDCGSVAE